MKIGGFQKCKTHFSILKGIRTKACQNWCKSAKTRIWTWAEKREMARTARVWILVLADLHQLWEALILKPFKLEKCILHFWKLPIFIYVILAWHGHSYILNIQKVFLKTPNFTTVHILGVCILFWQGVRLKVKTYIIKAHIMEFNMKIKGAAII